MDREDRFSSVYILSAKEMSYQSPYSCLRYELHLQMPLPLFSSRTLIKLQTKYQNYLFKFFKFLSLHASAFFPSTSCFISLSAYIIASAFPPSFVLLFLVCFEATLQHLPLFTPLQTPLSLPHSPYLLHSLPLLYGKVPRVLQ